LDPNKNDVPGEVRGVDMEEDAMLGLDRQRFYASVALPIMFMAAAPALGQSAAAGAGAPQAAVDASTSDEIIVTAQRRSERLRDVPIAITALNAEALEKAGVGNLRDLERVAPALQLPMYGGFLRPSIRGISSGLSTLGDSSNVAIYVDGVYQPTQTAAIVDLPDVANVQVLKGPQGSLYGQNATGGAMIIDTVAPSFDLTGHLSASYGNYDDKAVSGYVSGPLGDKVAVLVSGSIEDRGGYNRDLLRGGHDKGLRSKQVRGKLQFNATESVSFTLAGYWSKRNDSGVYTGAPYNGNSLGNALTKLLYPNTPVATKPHTFATSFPPDLFSKTYGASLLGKFELGSFGTLNTVSAYQHAKVTDIVDVDLSPINFAEVRPLVIPSRAFIQEVNFSSERLGRFTFTTGGFFMDRKEEFKPSEFGLYGSPYENYTGSPAPILQLMSYARSKKRSYAGYLEMSYDLTDQITITAAGRYSYEKVRAAGNGNLTVPILYPDPRGAISFKKFTPRAVIRYKPNAYHTLYASYSKGFKSGFVDYGNIGKCPGGPTDASCIPPPVKPETVDAFEIGYKGKLADGLNVSLAAFHYKYKQIQVFIYSAPNGFYLNAAAGRLNGFDFDINWEVSRDLKLTVGGSYVDSKYTNFPNASVYTPTPPAGCAANFVSYPCGNIQGPADVTGNQLERAPKFAATASIDYGHDVQFGRIGFNLSGNYNSGFPFDVNGHIRQKRYALVNAELSLEPKALPGVRLSLWGKNLSNHDYLQGTLPTGFSDSVSWSPPRTYGVRAEYRF
jgi:iron complex outermembrane receptor protein